MDMIKITLQDFINRSNIIHNNKYDYSLIDGVQHFEPTVRFGGEIEFVKRVNNDKIKTDFCQKNNIELLRIKYDENIIEKLKKYLNNHVNSFV